MSFGKKQNQPRKLLIVALAGFLSMVGGVFGLVAGVNAQGAAADGTVAQQDYLTADEMAQLALLKKRVKDAIAAGDDVWAVVDSVAASVEASGGDYAAMKSNAYLATMVALTESGVDPVEASQALIALTPQGQDAIVSYADYAAPDQAAAIAAGDYSRATLAAGISGSGVAAANSPLVPEGYVPGDVISITEPLAPTPPPSALRQANPDSDAAGGGLPPGVLPPPLSPE